MTTKSIAGRLTSLPDTLRIDNWATKPNAIAISLIAFVIYSTWAAFQNSHYEFQQYVSPFYSPNLADMFGWKYSPAFLVLWIPGGFRLTCYFGRRVYYRAFGRSPAACAVGSVPRDNSNYSGERKFPLVLFNLHRYFLYLAMALAILHWKHAWDAFWYQDQFHVGLGSIILTLDAVFLNLYVWSCHSFRHLAGGRLKCFSCVNGVDGSGSAGGSRGGGPVANYGMWRWVSRLNEAHGSFFWLSLFMVGFADLYVRLLAMEVITDVRFF